MATGWLWDERYMWHDTGHGGADRPAGGWVEPGEHAESPASKRRFRNLIEASGLLGELVSLSPRLASEDELLRLHAPAYVERIARLSAERGGDAGELVPFGAGSYEIARLAAGGVIVAVDAVLDGAVDNAYALVRPPGHHAEADRGRGFCIFANVALAVMHARAERGLERVAVVDWDVHHGNGTQDAFSADPDVLTISLHGENHYPSGRGGLDERGEGAGIGACLNVPLPHGCGVGAYVAAFERVVLPALRAFAPELIVVASGLDASALDPLGRMMLHSDGYRALTSLMLEVAEEACDGRLVLAHEGGYSTGYVPFCGLAIVETLAGTRTPVEDPFLEQLAGMTGQDLQPHQEAAIARAEQLLAGVGEVGARR